MVKIVSDSTCDLSKELLEKYQVTLIPLHVLMGDRDCRDGLDVTSEDIYEWADANNTTPKTSAVSPQEVLDVIEPLLQGDDEVLCFSISEKMSSTYSVMKMVCEDLDAADRVAVFDSANLSTGIGLLVIEAAVMAQKGMALKEIVTELEKLRPMVRSSFVVDTLTYLHRGGRCSGATALVGGMLKIHPKIVVQEGKMDVSQKYRGKMAKVIPNYAADMEADLKAAKKDRVFITHSGCEQAVIEQVYQYLEGLGIFEEILVTKAGCVISSHCGPGTLGVLFIAE